MKAPVKPSERDLHILQLAQHSSNLTVAQIAKALRTRPHVIRHSLERLRLHLEMTSYTPINTAALGFSQYQFIVDSVNATASLIQTLRSRLDQNDRVPLVIEILGGFKFAVWARNSCELTAIVDNLFSELVPLRPTRMTLVHSYHKLGTILGAAQSFRVYSLETLPKSIEIEPLDHEILQTISRVATNSASMLAKETGRPLTTINYRCQKLKQAGVLLEPIYILRKELPGWRSFELLVNIAIGMVSRHQVIQIAQSIPAVGAVVEATGS